MTNKTKQLWIQEKKKILFIFIIFFICFNSFAQTDTIYFDSEWKNCPKELAAYYRIPPEKIKTKKAVGYKISNVDSVYVIKDYYLKTDKLQFKGFSKDKEAQVLVGKSRWFDEKGVQLETPNYDYKVKNNSKLLNWQPIFYINYFITVKSQFAAGLEFCLDCKDSTYNGILLLGFGYGLSSYDNNYFGLPDIHLSLNFPDGLSFIKIGGSNRNLYAMAGLSLLNAIDLGFGYSYPLIQDKIPELKGFTFGLTLRLTNHPDVYPQIKIM